MATPEFSQQDAQTLVLLAENAPLRNLKEAENVSKLLQRFSAWYEHISKPSATPNPRKQRSAAEAPTAEDLTK
jgi:hypothetical protein